MKRTMILGLAFASTSAMAQQSITPRPLGATQAITKEAVGVVTLARQLPNGRIIVNDAGKRRLLLVDSTLQTFAVIADSTSGAVNSYGQRPGALIPYVADSTLYLDATAGSLLVIDPNGKVTRVMSPPRPGDNNILANTNTGFPGFDSRGRMVYRTAYPRVPQQTRDGSITMGQPPDSAPLIRVDLDTRKADTVGALKLPRQVANSITMPNGGTMSMSTPAPLPTIDDWSLLSDGSIAILRGRDYHIDWILPDGSKRSTEKIPFEWKRLTDEDKLALVDSITKTRANAQPGGPGNVMMMDGGTRIMIGGGGGGDFARGMVAGMAAGVAAPPPPPASSTSSTASTSSSSTSSATSAKPADGKATAGAADGKAGMAAGAIGAIPQGMAALPPPAASDLPDYMPPFANSSARPDADAHLWVRTTTPGSAQGSVVYDVIDNRGQLSDRVDVPRGMSIVGFGRGGVVFLTKRDADGIHLVRATVH
jgi:hypothetical protein